MVIPPPRKCQSPKTSYSFGSVSVLCQFLDQFDMLNPLSANPTNW